MSDYETIKIDDPGETCPDPDCRGPMGMIARAHQEWSPNTYAAEGDR